MLHHPSDGSRSKALHDRAKRSLPGGNTRTTVYRKPYPLYAVRGAGCRVVDADHDVRIDCVNNYTSLIHGHAHPAIVEAACAQIATGTAFGMPTELEIELAELLADRVASIEQVRFTNSGTEAVMMAIKAARAFTGRGMIAKCEGAYHGSYDFAEISQDSSPDNWGDRQPVSTPLAKGTPQGVVDNVLTLPFNDPATSLRLIREHGSELAAILVDPLPIRIGLIPADQLYLEVLREAADEIGAVLIFDEVVSFRLAYHGAQSLWNVTPDLTTLAKIIGGGFPVGAVGGRAEVMAVFDPSAGKPALPHGGTFSANPVTMRAGLESMKLLDAAAFARLDAMGERLRHEIDLLFKQHGLPGRTTGMGSLLKVHFNGRDPRDYRSAYPDAAEHAALARFGQGLLDRGVIATTEGLLVLSTPMQDSDLDEIVEACDGALGELAEARVAEQLVD